MAILDLQVNVELLYCLHPVPSRPDVTLFASTACPMIVHAFQRFRLWVAAQLVRRGIAVSCAIAFVLVGLAHSIHHFNGTASTAAIQADLGSFDDGPDVSKKAPVVIGHCHGCSMIAMAALAPPVVPTPVAVDLPTRKFDQHRPHTPAAETPPPKSSI